MANDLKFKTMNAVHRAVMWVTGGRAGWTIGNMPVIELTTTGRKSGLARAVMLTSPLQEGETIVVVASRGGDDNAPAWLFNIQANPSVDVVVNGGASQKMTARVATPQERSRMWPLVTADHQNYAGYQKKTDREIPLVLLEPVT